MDRRTDGLIVASKHAWCCMYSVVSSFVSICSSSDVRVSNAFRDVQRQYLHSNVDAAAAAAAAAAAVISLHLVISHASPLPLIIGLLL